MSNTSATNRCWGTWEQSCSGGIQNCTNSAHIKQSRPDSGFGLNRGRPGSPGCHEDSEAQMVKFNLLTLSTSSRRLARPARFRVVPGHNGADHKTYPLFHQTNLLLVYPTTFVARFHVVKRTTATYKFRTCIGTRSSPEP